MISMNVFRELYNYRELLKTNIKKEIRGKYKGSWLGILWTFLNPLLMLAVYAFVFPYILRVKVENYTIFMIVALIPWNLFTTAIQNGTNSVTQNGAILKKVYFPREIIPISVVCAGLINFLISCFIILLFVIFGGVGVSINLVWLPLIALIQSVFSLGLLLILSAINVYVKDIQYLVQFLVNLVFYGTPILYSTAMFPEKYRWILYLNPLAHMLDAYRAIFYYKTMPDLQSLGIVGGVSFVVLVLGYAIFKKLEKGFAEEV